MKATSAPPESVNGSTVRLDTVDKFVFAGLQERFLSVFNTKTVWTTSNDKVKALEKLFPEKNAPGGKITYPYAFLIPDSWQKVQDRGSIRSSSMRGARVQVASNNLSTLKARYLAVDFVVKVEWYFNDFEVMTDVGRRWLFIQQKGSLNFQVAYGQTSFDITTVPDDTVNFPTMEADPDNVQEYPLTTSLVVRGFISEAELIGEGVVEALEVSGVLNEPASTDSTFFSFKTPPLRP